MPRTPYTSGMQPPEKRILVVDDDPEIRSLIVDILLEDGYSVYACPSGEQAVGALRSGPFDLVLADIRMPRMSGIDLLMQMRGMSLDTEVILMTAYASVETAVEALRGEAFDYLIKPFSLREFRQRVQQAMRAPPARVSRHAVRYHGELSIDLNARRSWRGDEEIKLTRHEFDVLAYLFEHQGCAVSREELLGEVWRCTKGDERSFDTVKSCVCRLRKKIGDDAREPRHILNVWGVGYQLGY
jgi:DNA-binding response OmpR family regulator